MKIAYPILALALCAATLTACSEVGVDDVVNECTSPAPLVLAPPLDVPEGITLREQGPPEASYIDTWGGAKIQGKQFCEAVLACADVEDPAWLLTRSSYAPDVTDDQRVLGLGGSAFVSGDLATCYELHWQANGAVDL